MKSILLALTILLISTSVFINAQATNTNISSSSSQVNEDNEAVIISPENEEEVVSDQETGTPEGSPAAESSNAFKSAADELKDVDGDVLVFPADGEAPFIASAEDLAKDLSEHASDLSDQGDAIVPKEETQVPRWIPLSQKIYQISLAFVGFTVLVYLTA